MAKFINPFTDIGFKRIFGQEISKPLIIDFLNSLMEGEELQQWLADHADQYEIEDVEVEEEQ